MDEFLRTLADAMADATPEEVYRMCVSHHQREKSQAGKRFERRIAALLDAAGVAYAREVAVAADGTILGRRGARGARAAVDFVVPPPRVGARLADHAVLSCKRTARERWTQDAWMADAPPRLYALVTDGDDYPAAERFGASATRVLVSFTPRAGAPTTAWEDLLGRLRPLAPPPPSGPSGSCSPEAATARSASL